VFVTRCLTQARQIAGIVGKFIGDVARYYWGLRGLLWEFIAGMAPNLASESLRFREVRLSPHEGRTMAEFDDGTWKVSIPGRCVVCGDAVRKDPVIEELSIDDAARAFWVPLGTFLAGTVLSIVLWNRWVVVLSIPLGFVLGYLLQSRMSVRLQIIRCDQHTTRTNIPQVLAWGTTLVLRFGNKLVRRVFLYGESMDTAVPQAEAPATDPFAPAVHEPPVPYNPPTIPLADSPDPADAKIQYDADPAFKPSDEPPSPEVH
jgi:hypothetical protein